MHFANVQGRLALIIENRAVDVAEDSDGLLPSDPLTAFERWADVGAWARGPHGPGRTIERGALRAPSPRPRQVFAVGLNYRSHATESGLQAPEHPSVFTKFPTCIGSPAAPLDAALGQVLSDGDAGHER